MQNNKQVEEERREWLKDLERRERMNRIERRLEQSRQEREMQEIHEREKREMQQAEFFHLKFPFNIFPVL